MKTRLIEVDMDLIHDEYEYDNYKFSICLFNDSYEIPVDWYDSDEHMELKLNFTIDLIIESFIEGNECLCSYEDYKQKILDWDENTEPLPTWKIEDEDVVFSEVCKGKVEALKHDLQKAIDTLNKIKYISLEKENETNK